MSDGSGGAPAGTISPHSPSRPPPTGFAGTGSGAGAVAPGGTSSEVSTAGGGCVRCAQSSVDGVSTVSLGGTYGSPFGAAATGTVTSNEPLSMTTPIKPTSRVHILRCRRPVRLAVVRRSAEWAGGDVIIGADCSRVAMRIPSARR